MLAQRLLAQWGCGQCYGSECGRWQDGLGQEALACSRKGPRTEQGWFFSSEPAFSLQATITLAGTGLYELPHPSPARGAQHHAGTAVT